MMTLNLMFGYSLLYFAAGLNQVQIKPIPTILDTDIGTDYDDQMALIYILSNPLVFDLKLVICSTFNTTARAQIVAKTLREYNRFDVPIGIGRNTGIDSIYEYSWAEKYSLNEFVNEGGTIYFDGEDALLREMQKANVNNIYYFIEISPATSLGHVLPHLSSDTLKYIHLFAMAGSVYRGYGNTSQPSKEYNVVKDILAAQLMFQAPWASFSLAPVDCTNFMQFDGVEWQTFISLSPESSLIASLLESYSVWYNNGGKYNGAMKPFSPAIGTSTMHDVLAVFLAATYPKLYTVVMNALPLVVSSDGFTKVNFTSGKLITTCVDFLSSDSFLSTEIIGTNVLNSIANN